MSSTPNIGAVSVTFLDAEDGLGVKDLVGSFEGELEAPEVSEGAPSFRDERPVEQIEAIAIGDGSQSRGGLVGAAVDSPALVPGSDRRPTRPWDRP